VYLLSLSDSISPPKFESRKEYLDYLQMMMTSPVEESEEFFGETRGRPRLLKSYLMESNRGLPESHDGLLVKKSETGLPEVTALTLKYQNKNARFLVDTSDRRFWVLHTSALSDEARFLFDKLVYSPKGCFDKAWIPSQMIQEVADLPRNDFKGFGLDYLDFFELNPEQQVEASVEELSMRVSGGSSILALKALMSEKKLQSSLAYSSIRVRRGDRKDYVINELTYDGRFSARGGSSIDAYNSMIEITSKKYRNLIEWIERNSLGVKEVENRTLVKGQAFDLIFKREIEDLSLFIDILASSKQPFRLWGVKNKITNDHYQVIGVDLHTGDSIDLELSSYLMRVYLPEGSCGNTVLRLFTNLQHYFDSNIILNDTPLQVTE
jgi:hypothetical protein